MNETNKTIIEKAEFFHAKEILAHVQTIPKGTFRNGRFASKLEGGQFFWFIGLDGIPFRLFLNEIVRIDEYKERGK